MKKQAVLKDRTYRLLGATAPLSYSLNTRNSRRKPLLHFDGQSNRALRYASNQQTPFEDDQDGNAILEPIVFEDGMLSVSKENQVLQKFLELHPSNGYVFEEIKDEDLRRAFLEYGAEWWWETNRKLPINIALLNRWPFGYTCQSFTVKQMEIVAGPEVRLQDCITKRIKRRSINLMKKNF